MIIVIVVLRVQDFTLILLITHAMKMVNMVFMLETITIILLKTSANGM